MHENIGKGRNTKNPFNYLKMQNHIPKPPKPENKLRSNKSKCLTANFYMNAFMI